MKPALSVVAFTVLSGAGLGALALLALVDVTALLGVLAVISAPRSACVDVAMALVVTASSPPLPLEKSATHEVACGRERMAFARGGGVARATRLARR